METWPARDDVCVGAGEGVGLPKSEGPPLELENKKRNGPLGSTGIRLNRLGWVQIEVQTELQTVPDIEGLGRQAVS